MRREVTRLVEEEGVEAHRRLLPLVLPPPGPRAARRRDHRRALPGPLRHALLRRLPAHPRVRADEHRGAQRLRLAPGPRPTSASSPTRRSSSACEAGRTSFMQSLGGHISAREAMGRADPAQPLGPGRRRRRRQPVRRGAGRAQHHHRRPRRHQLRHRAGPRRPPGLRAPDRDQPPADRALDRRHPRDRRRRRLDLLGRRARPAAGRARTARAPSPARPATATAAREPTITDSNRSSG